MRSLIGHGDGPDDSRKEPNGERIRVGWGLIVREGITYLSRIEGAQDPLVCPRLGVRFEAGQRTSRRRRWPLRDRGGREVIFHLSPGSLTLGRGPTTTISHRA